MLRLCACERPCEVTAAAQVRAVSPLTISALRRAVAAEPAYARALQLPHTLLHGGIWLCLLLIFLLIIVHIPGAFPARPPASSLALCSSD